MEYTELSAVMCKGFYGITVRLIIGSMEARRITFIVCVILEVQAYCTQAKEVYPSLDLH